MGLTGDMEKTMLNRLCMSQNLRVLLNPEQLPTSIHPIITHYEKAFRSDIRGTLLQDIFSVDGGTATASDTLEAKEIAATSLTLEYRELLQGWIHDRGDIPEARDYASGRACFITKFRRFGQIYQTVDSSPRDSYVIYRDKTSPTLESAGRIRDMFTKIRTEPNGMRRTMTFIVLDRYEELSLEDAKWDHYRQFPVVGGRCYYTTVASRPILVTSDDLISHFAHTAHVLHGMKSECLHALPLDKVCA